ncbi:MAG: cellulose-binding protein [Alteromonadaceae bacterium]|nr:MAG: cellulose-binding protein [Alteromonadaceae bacterium]
MRNIWLLFVLFFFYSYAHGQSGVVEPGVESGNIQTRSSMGMNLNRVADWSSQFPFLNLMRWSREWYDWPRKSDQGIEVNEHGQLTGVAEGVIAGTVFLSNRKGYPLAYTHYIVRWQGKGSLDYRWCAKKVGRAHKGDRIQVSHGSCLLTVLGFDPKDPIRNISVVPEKHIAAFDRGEVFNPDFIARIGDFRALRFMGWMQTNNSEQKTWEQRPVPEDRSFAEQGVPFELMIQLANLVGADPWFNIPHQADDAYIKAFAQMVHKQLKPELTTYIEYSNEVWNSVFRQKRFARKQAQQRWKQKDGNAFYQWYGLRSAEVCDIWKGQVFTSQSQRVRCVMGAHAAWFGLEKAALDCPLWKQAKGGCYRHGFDVLAIAAYFNGCLTGHKPEDPGVKYTREWLKLPDSGLTKAYEQALDGRHFPCKYDATAMENVYRYHADVAKKHGLELVAYEGGQHITNNMQNSQNEEALIKLHTGLNRDPRMYDLYQRNFASWRKAGGGLFMHFSDVGRAGKHGSWGALEYVTQPTSSKWEAILKQNSEPCWWPGCDGKRE